MIEMINYFSKVAPLLFEHFIVNVWYIHFSHIMVEIRVIHLTPTYI